MLVCLDRLGLREPVVQARETRQEMKLNPTTHYTHGKSPHCTLLYNILTSGSAFDSSL